MRACILLSFLVSTSAQTPREVRDALQAVAAAQSVKYNCSVSIAVHSAWGHAEAAAGVVDESTGQNAHPSDKYAWGSGTKPMTGASVLKLASLGVLDLDDKAAPLVDRALSRMAAKINQPSVMSMAQLWGEENVSNISIRQLLSMQAGIPDFDTANGNDAEPTDMLRARLYDQPDQINSPLDLMSLPWVAQNFKPCKSTCYSSTNFMLLGLILAGHSGADSWAEFDQASFLPPSLKDAVHFASTGSPHQWGTVHGYDRTSYNMPAGTTNNRDVSDVNGVFAGWTAADLVGSAAAVAELAWDIYGPKPRIAPAEFANLMATPSGHYGLATFNLNSHTGQNGSYGVSYGHIGATYGFDSIIAYFPALEFSMAIATNIETDHQQVPAEALCMASNAVAGAMLGKKFLCRFEDKGYHGGGCKCDIAETSMEPALPWAQSHSQQDLVSRTRRNSTRWSHEASYGLEAYFDSLQFRNHLRECCPLIAHLSKHELLQLFESQVQASELTHNVKHGSTSDVNLNQLDNASYFYNLWQLYRLGSTSNPAEPEQTAETSVYHFQPFKDTYEPTFYEASNRMIYAAVNWLRVDLGIEHYGDVGFVFKPSVVRDSLLLSAVDSGIWEIQCNRSSSDEYDVNCDAINNETISRTGTQGAINHLAIPNMKFWNGTSRPLIDLLFARWFSAQTQNLSYYDVRSTYLEAGIASNVLLPNGVRFVLASFPKLFGSSDGRSLQSLCAKKGWGLVWALGLNGADKHSNDTYPLQDRLLDPWVAKAVAVNLTAASMQTGLSIFNGSWQQGFLDREAGIEITAPYWAALWGSLGSKLPRSFHLSAIRANQCANMDDCIGVDSESDCLCSVRSSGAQHKEAGMVEIMV